MPQITKLFDQVTNVRFHYKLKNYTSTFTRLMAIKLGKLA